MNRKNFIRRTAAVFLMAVLLLAAAVSSYAAEVVSIDGSTFLSGSVLTEKDLPQSVIGRLYNMSNWTWSYTEKDSDGNTSKWASYLYHTEDDSLYNSEGEEAQPDFTVMLKVSSLDTGEEVTLDGECFTVTIGNYAMDREGNLLDMKITVSDIVYYAYASGAEEHSAYSVLSSSGGGIGMWLGSLYAAGACSSHTTKSFQYLNYHADFSLVNHDTQEEIDGNFLFAVRDLDSSDTAHPESITLEDGFSSDYTWITQDSTVQVSGGGMTFSSGGVEDDTTLTSGFIACADASGFSLTFSSSRYRGAYLFYNFKSTVTASVSGGNGSITRTDLPDLPTYTSVYWRNDAVYTITPDDGYAVSSLTLDGEEVDLETALTDNGDGTYTYTLEEVIAAHTITVSFEPVYSISYDPNGGSVTDADTMQTVSGISYNEEVTLEENTFAAPASLYVFYTWNTSADGSGYTVRNGAVITADDIGVTTENHEITLYAQWILKSYTTEYISTNDVYDEENQIYIVDNGDGTVSTYSLLKEDGTLMSAEEAFPPETATGYWSQIEDDVWIYTFYVDDETLSYYVYEESLTTEELSDFIGDYTVYNPDYIEDGSEVSEITNEDGSTGSLTVRKEVLLTDGTDYDSDDLFTFAITLTDADGNALTESVTCGGYTFNESGVLYVTLQDDESITIEGIPEGYHYSVEEILTDEQKESYTWSYDANQDGVISADETVETVVKNSSDTIIPKYGSIQIKKIVEDASGNVADDETAFTVTVTLTDQTGEALSGEATYGDGMFTDGVWTTQISSGQTINITDIPAGYQYSVVETDADGYSTVYQNQVGTVQTDTIAYVTITNTQCFGSLTITKYVQYEDGTAYDTDAQFRIRVTLTDTDGNALSGTQTYGETSFTDGVPTKNNGYLYLTADESITFTDIPAGYHYTVTEELTDAQGEVYTVTCSGSITQEGETGVITANETAAVNITNIVPPAPETVDLTLIKKIDGNYDTDDGLYTFYVSLTGLEAQKNYDLTYYTAQETQNGEEETDTAEDETEDETEDEDAGWTVTEAANGNVDSFTADADGNAVIKILLAADEKAVLADLPVSSTYQVTEQSGAYAPSYTVEDSAGAGSIVSDSGSAQEGETLSTAEETAETGEAVQITFTNTITRTVNLSLEKICLTAAGDPDEADTSSYTITAFFTGLKAGNGYAYTDETQTFYFYADEEGNAAVKLSITNGMKYTFRSIPVGAQYWFTETACDRLAAYTVTDEAQMGSIAMESGANESTKTALQTAVETADEEEEVTVTFTNRKYTAQVRIAKKSADTGALIGGAEFSLYAGSADADTDDDEDAQETADEADGLIGVYETISDADSADFGYTEWIELEPGTYYFVETEAPDGYAGNGTVISFTITEDDIGSQIEVTANDSVLSILASTGGIGIVILLLGSLAAMGAAMMMHMYGKRAAGERRSR